jgi:hypothetical protein
MSFSDAEFLRIIASSRIHPENAISNLYSFTSDIQVIRVYKSNIENHFKKYLNNFEKSILYQLGILDINDWLNNKSQIEKKTNKVVQAINSNTLIDSFKNQVENIDIKKWTKSSFSLLKNLIIEHNERANYSGKFSSIIVDGREKAIQNVDLSIKAKVTKRNLENIIDATKKYMTNSELEQVILELVEKYVR